MEVFCFFMGVLFCYTHHYYIPFLFLALFYLTPRSSLLLFLLAGFSWAWIHQWWESPINMPKRSMASPVLLEGTIVSLPVVNKNKTQFVYSVQRINHHKAKALIQLSWYNASVQVHAGEKWRFTAKLRVPRNFLNPGSYDYVRTLQTKHITWIGTIYGHQHYQMTATQRYYWLSWRERLTHQLTQLAPNLRTAGIIEALTLNNTIHISQEDWSLFRRTGTTHLFGISGEHIALVSGLFFFLFRRLWSRSAYCCRLMPAHALASAGSFLIAFAYACLAGFAPPVQRALIGCFFYAFSYMGIQRFTPWQVWRYALLGVLCIEPHAVFMQGFYFSFLAVVCLLLTHQRWQLRGYKGNLALQLSCLIGLMPLSLYWFSYGSINGFIANVFAIPLVGFLIIPLSLFLLCICFYDWAWVVVIPLEWCINLLFQGLTWTEHLAGININWSLNTIDLVICLLGALLLWVLLPAKPIKNLAFLWLVFPLFPAKEVIKPGEALIHVLDVGQGLAVSVRTKHHVLLYDTGDQFFNGSDLGQMVVVPFYQNQGIKKIDALIISHPDKDHWGGLKSIESALTVERFIVNEPHYYRRGLNCHDYPEWNWDKVHFRFFPIHTHFKSKNNNSCILQISTLQGKVLLPGDIEQPAEEYLIQTYGTQLQSDVLLLPHHGSKTSSSYRFLLEVAPQYAIASLGFANRFRFPHAKTLASLAALHIPFYRTDECGMVRFHLAAKKKMQSPQCFNHFLPKMP